MYKKGVNKKMSIISKVILGAVLLVIGVQFRKKSRSLLETEIINAE